MSASPAGLVVPVFRVSGALRPLQARRCLYVRTQPPPPPEQLPQVERVPVDWKYVQQLLPRRTVPAISEKEHYPSGWLPQRGRRSPAGERSPAYVKQGCREWGTRGTYSAVWWSRGTALKIRFTGLISCASYQSTLALILLIVKGNVAPLSWDLDWETGNSDC